MTIKTRQVKPLSRSASLGSLDAEKRTVEVVWTTGAPVLRSSWMDGPFWETLSLDPKAVRMGRLNGGAPFLANHDGGDVAATLGVVERASINGNEGVALVRFAAEGIDPEADKIFKKIADKVIRNVSVGYRTYKVEKVEGGDGKIPTFRAVDWEPYEISAVAMGADAGAGFRGAEQTHEVTIHTEESKRMDPEELKRQEEAKRQAAEQAALASRAAEIASVEEKRMAGLKAEAEKAGAAQERERASGIRSACRAAKIDDSTAEKMIADGVSLVAARNQVLDMLVKRQEATPTDPHFQGTVTGGETSSEKFIRGATAWLIEKSGNGVVERARALAQDGKLGGNFRHAEEFKKVELDGGEFRGMSLLDLARESLERRGVKTRGMSRERMVDTALNYRDNAYSPASDFAVIYESVLHKMLLGAYATQPDSWSRFCKTDTVPDFRPSNRYRVGSFGTMDVVPEGGEYKNKGIPDGQKYTIQTETKGNMIAISRQAIINDDMSANADLAARFGRGFRLTIESEVFALLAQNSGLGPTQSDAQPFFHANRANVSTGVALTVAGLDADRVQMALQKDISANEYLNLRPSILLVPVSLGATAKRLNSADYDTDGTKLNQPNVVKGLFKEVVDSPRISGTRRYAFADPAVAPAIVVAFLEGSGEAPMLEQQLGWRTDGLEWKAKLDFKAQMFDPKGAVSNAGV